MEERIVVNVKVAPLGEIKVIPVTEEELEILKRGKKSPIQHAIAVALFSSALGLSVTFALNFPSLEP